MKTKLLFLSSILTVIGFGFAGAQDSDLSFFLTSRGPGDGANLGGLAGADAHCQSLAAAVGAGGKTWRAYLSTTGGDSPVNARDRIGSGPWTNANGVVVATDVDDLHSDNNKLSKANSVTESGHMINGRGDSPNRHDILSGSTLDGMAFTDGEGTLHARRLRIGRSGIGPRVTLARGANHAAGSSSPRRSSQRPGRCSRSGCSTASAAPCRPRARRRCRRPGWDRPVRPPFSIHPV